jgi:hypothetical protein
MTCRCHPASRCGKCQPATCALCTDEITGATHREPFGRDGALVNVCSDCSSVHPRSGRYGFSGSREVSKGVGIRRLDAGTGPRRGRS